MIRDRVDAFQEAMLAQLNAGTCADPVAVPGDFTDWERERVVGWLEGRGTPGFRVERTFVPYDDDRQVREPWSEEMDTGSYRLLTWDDRRWIEAQWQLVAHIRPDLRMRVLV